MAYEKKNTGGKKFQGRQEGEKRSRTTKTRPGSTRNSKDKISAYNEKSTNYKSTRNSADNSNSYGKKEGADERKFAPRGEYKGSSGGYNRNKSDDRSSRPFSKPRTEGGDDRKFSPRGEYKGSNSGNNRNKSEGGDRSSRPYNKNRSEGGEERRFTPRGEYNSNTSRPYNKTRNQDGDTKRGFSDRENRRDSGNFGKSKPPYKKREDDSYTDRPTRTRNSGAKKEGDSREFADKRKTFGTGRNPSSFGSGGGKREYTKRGEGKPNYVNKNRNDETKKPRLSAPDNFKGRKRSFDKASDNLVSGKTLVEQEVRLNRFIANSGLCSRREADLMISQGLVTVNKETVTELGTKVKPGDDVRADGKRITPEKEVYILLNKPKGYITTTTDPDERATVLDLIDMPGKERIYPVGRLDRNTSGVLLLTNDGELAQKLMHPSFEIKKIYKAKLDRKPSKEHMLAWVDGVELEDGYMSFEQIGFVDADEDNTVGLEVHSGRNRIVRRMFEHFGYDVKSLDRAMLGEFDHVKLGRGKWRLLNDREIQYVERLKRMKPKRK